MKGDKGLTARSRPIVAVPLYLRKSFAFPKRSNYFFAAPPPPERPTAEPRIIVWHAGKAELFRK